jgi:D-tyrosyl-tRNA(Tyr) deacylase
MRAVLQRVSRAEVSVDGERVASVGRGYLVLLGVTHTDDEADARYIADKIASLRLFEDEAGKINLGITDIGGEVLVVSQFTLYADCRKGAVPASPTPHRRRWQTGCIGGWRRYCGRRACLCRQASSGRTCRFPSSTTVR